MRYEYRTVVRYDPITQALNIDGADGWRTVYFEYIVVLSRWKLIQEREVEEVNSTAESVVHFLQPQSPQPGTLYWDAWADPPHMHIYWDGEWRHLTRDGLVERENNGEERTAQTPTES